MVEKLLVLTIGPITLRIPASISYKHHSQQEVEETLKKIADIFKVDFPYLEELENKLSKDEL